MLGLQLFDQRSQGHSRGRFELAPAQVGSSWNRVGWVPIVQQRWGKWIVKLWCDILVNQYGCNLWTFWRCDSVFKGKILAMLAYRRVNLLVIAFPRSDIFWTKLPKHRTFLRGQKFILSNEEISFCLVSKWWKSIVLHQVVKWVMYPWYFTLPKFNSSPPLQKKMLGRRSGFLLGPGTFSGANCSC